MRNKGLLPISANFEPQIAEPFDSRNRVSKKEDLINQDIWKAKDNNIYTYIGMIVSVWDDTINNGLYRLKSIDYSIEANWEKVGEQDLSQLATKAEVESIILNYLSISGTNYIIAQGKGTPIENAIDLQLTYNIAKLMSPSKENVITVMITPGKYDFGENVFTVNTSFINLVSLSSDCDVFLNGINITISDVLLRGINCTESKFNFSSNLTGIICENCVGGNESFCIDVDIDIDTIPEYNYSIDYYSSKYAAYNINTNIFNNCIGGDYSFGKLYSINFDTYINCKGGNLSFSASGEAGGRYDNCTGGDYSFGGSNDPDVLGIASGNFNQCIAGIYSFGGSGTLSGILNNCIGDNNSFGGDITSSAKLYYCRLNEGNFKIPTSGGKIVACIEGNDDLVYIS